MQKHMRCLSRKSLLLSAVCRNFGGINNGGTKCAVETTYYGVYAKH